MADAKDRSTSSRSRSKSAKAGGSSSSSRSRAGSAKAAGSSGSRSSSRKAPPTAGEAFAESVFDKMGAGAAALGAAAKGMGVAGPCPVGFCPVGMFLTAAGMVRPEVVEHLMAAAAQLMMATKAVVEARADEVASDEGIERIVID